MTTRRLHYLSGLLLAAFIGLHLINHLYAMAGPGKHIEVMNALRLVYRNLLVETLLLLAVLVQVVSGVRLYKRCRTQASSAFARLHLYSGLYLAVFFVIHVGSVLVGRTVLQLDTNFYYGVAGLNTFPYNLFFVPYYGLAVLSFFGHVAAIHYQKMKRPVLGVSPARQAIILLVAGALSTIGIFYGLTNRFKGVDIPQEYQVLVGR